MGNNFIKMTLPEIKKHHGLTDRDIAKALGYKSTIAYQSSSAKNRVDKGLEFMYNLGMESKYEK